jgi:hypothetical protein
MDDAGILNFRAGRPRSRERAWRIRAQERPPELGGSLGTLARQFFWPNEKSGGAQRIQLFQGNCLCASRSSGVVGEREDVRRIRWEKTHEPGDVLSRLAPGALQRLLSIVVRTAWFSGNACRAAALDGNYRSSIKSRARSPGIQTLEGIAVPLGGTSEAVPPRCLASLPQTWCHCC